MADLQQLEEIYEEYEEKLEEAKKGAGPFAGAFGMGDDPRKDVCNQAFYEKLDGWAREFRDGQPEPREAAQGVDFILEYPFRHRESGTYWFAYAAQKHAMALIPLLEKREAVALAGRFDGLYPKRERLPVQREILDALREQGGVKETGKERNLLGQWLPRVILLLMGLVVAHFGVSLFLLASLGSDPFNVMIQGIQRLLPALTHGTVHIGISLLIVLALLAVDRSYIRVGTFLCMILGGPIIDVFNLLLSSLVNAQAPMAVRITAVVLGCVILAFGMTIVIKSQAGTGPNDLVAVVLSDKTGWKFGPVRVGVDMLFTLTGWLLGGVVGVGTLICMTLVGPVAQRLMPISEELCKRFWKK